jgi:hypothetical protein
VTLPVFFFFSLFLCVGFFFFAIFFAFVSLFHCFVIQSCVFCSFDFVFHANQIFGVFLHWHCTHSSKVGVLVYRNCLVASITRMRMMLRRLAAQSISTTLVSISSLSLFSAFLFISFHFMSNQVFERRINSFRIFHFITDCALTELCVLDFLLTGLLVQRSKPVTLLSILEEFGSGSEEVEVDAPVAMDTSEEGSMNVRKRVREASDDIDTSDHAEKRVRIDVEADREGSSVSLLFFYQSKVSKSLQDPHGLISDIFFCRKMFVRCVSMLGSS